MVFAAEASWDGKLTTLGFEEDLVRLAPEPDTPQDAGQFWKDFIRGTAPEFRKPTIDQLETVVKPVWQELIDGARYCQPQLIEIIARVRPEVIVEDNVIGFPALTTAGVPFVRIMSCNPLEMKGPNIAPVFSGYPADDRSGWADFLAEYDRTHRPIWEQFNEWVVAQGAPALPDLEFIADLMRRTIAALGRTPHRYIVSKGPLHDELELADNMIGAEFLPQTRILPTVDLVITHGGNNTTTEAMHFGKPMIVLPLFWDQYDNAQRVQERGYGVRLDTYRYTDEELHAAIDRLLGDDALRARIAADGAAIREADGLRVAADAIERLGAA